ncbi:MAG: VPLPA-CTERM sorting domain-containing protein [Paracoccaceae bacterium]
MKITSIVLAAAMTVAAGAANAASVSFAVNNGWSTSGHTFGDVSVIGATMTENGRIRTNDEYVASWAGRNGGLGIVSGNAVTYGDEDRRRRGTYYDQHTIDGQGANEMALLNFGSMNVEIRSVTFNYWDRNDDFDVGVFDSLARGTQASPFRDDLDWGHNGSTRTFYFRPGTLVGSIFGFGADGPSDEFKLAGISYREVAAVPLPAGAALLLTGLAGFGAMRRRKNEG